MAGELVSFGIQKLWDLLSQEYTQFKGVEDQVTELKTDLNVLKSFLKDADAKKHKNTMVRNCVEEIKEIIYDAEDILETFILRDQLKRSGGIKKRIGRFASCFTDRKKFASDMGSISKRISKVITNMQTFGVVQQMVVDGNEYSLPLQESLREMRQEFAGECENDLVGLEANVEKLVGYLVEEDNVQVVSVIGMGGLGKTTLARQTFNHDKVKSNFDRLAWVCVTQEFNRKSVWQTILKSFKTKEEDDKIMRMEEDTLQVELFQMLETSKSLIVIDDIWEQEHWDRIRKIFPTTKGWKVLLTSRNASVAVYGNTLIKFEPQCLTNQDSWTLFQRIAFPRKEASDEVLEIDEGMEKMGKQMVEHCGGLPLAVRVLGGLLAAKYTLHDWKRLSENIGSHIMGGRTDFSDGKTTSLNHVLSLSFAELPSYLKYCFLYLAHFPEDYEIDVEILSYYWASEGILHYDRENIRDVGESYIEELVRRNMVISKRDVTTLRFETCHLHDMMREICLSKAKEENFLHFLGINSQTTHSQSSTTSRRFVSQNPTKLHVERDIKNPNVRSLVVFWDNSWSREWNLSSLSFTRLQLLRVLHIPQVVFEAEILPSSIGELIHLRYLSLESVRVNSIPSSLGNLKVLIYLNINVIGVHIFVPNVLMGMKGLRYLALPSVMDLDTKLELSNLVELETLINFSEDNSSLEDLHGMSRLRTLGIKLSGETSLKTLSASIGGLRHMENLMIKYFDDPRMNEEDGTILDFINLKQFTLEIFGSLSSGLHFHSHLTILTLYKCSLEEDPMPVVEKLLHLKEFYLGYKAFCGRKMVCSVGGFPQLQKLLLSQLKEWEEWIVEEGSMNLLHTLIIHMCEKLKELPDGLRFITSLKHLEIWSEEEKWKNRLAEGGEDYYKVQHIPSIHFY